MDHLHIRLPEDLKCELKRHCRQQNVAVTSAIIMMIVKELRERNLATEGTTDSHGDGPSLGFILRQ